MQKAKQGEMVQKAKSAKTRWGEKAQKEEGEKMQKAKEDKRMQRRAKRCNGGRKATEGKKM